jgi:hypothetical protein
MSVAREAVYAALFAKLSAVPGIRTASRRLRHWADLPPSQQPALFQVQKAEAIGLEDGLPPRRQLSVELYLYATGSDPGVPPSSILNPLIDAIEATLAPVTPGTTQTLGGLVQHAWIAGRIETDEGVLGDQAVAILPVDILVP